jgi:4-amino-4-deoxy-L-arabinose transferase-like glycosyltransferase
MSTKTKLILFGIVLCGLFFNLIFKDRAPACFNADEAAFSYNAYSIFKTGRDEYGAFIPLRLKSFGDYKLPLLSYVTAPIVGIFGLNETTARLPNTFVAILMPIVVYFLVKELFERDDIALLSAFLITGCLGLNIVGRHLHEAYLTVLLISASFLFFVKILKKFSWKNASLFLVLIFMSLFSYHFSRIFAGGFFIYSLFHFWPKKTGGKTGRIFLGVFIGVITIFALTDIVYKPERVKNLLYFNNPGYVKRIQELREEGGMRLFYNKLMPGVKEVISTSMTYFSPQFLVINGDENPRFGFPSMSTITMIEYVFALFGVYFLFRNKERFRGILIFLLLLTPLAASLSWAGLSLTRTLFIFIPLAALSSYGFFESMKAIKDKLLQQASILLAIVVYMGLMYYQWDFYLLHYPRRAIVVRAWQCGYKDMTDYVKKNYNKYDTFYISKLNGQPYIFMLFYMSYPPDKYQKVAKLSPPDQYGFGQVESFDKFNFNFKVPKKETKENALLIGYPTDDFKSQAIPVPNLDSVKVIRKETEEMFWIYDNKKLNH